MRNRIIRTFIFIVALVVVSNYAIANQNDSSNVKSDIVILNDELEKLDLNNPINDLQRNLKDGEQRFVGIYGFALYCPGIKGGNKIYIKKYGVKPIEGTSDALENEEHSKLVFRAIGYAEQYNKALLEKLNKNF